MISVRNLYKTFKTQKGDINVLNGINIDIKKGEKVAIIGPSGSGKSTFLRCLNRLEEATSGEIFFEGQNILEKNCDIDKVRQEMGMVFQHFNLFPHLTVQKNITLAPVSLGLLSQDEANKSSLDLLKKLSLIHLSFLEGKNKELL